MSYHDNPFIIGSTAGTAAGQMTLIMCGVHHTMHNGVCQQCQMEAIFGMALARLAAISDRMEKSLEHFEAEKAARQAAGG